MKTTHYVLGTTPKIRFVEGSLVFLNGVLQLRGEDYTKNSSKGTIYFKYGEDKDRVAIVEQE